MSGVEWHEFDKAHFHVLLARESCKVCHFVFIVTTYDDRVDLDWFQAGVFCGLNSREHALQNIDARHLLEHVSLQTVQANRNAIQSGGFQSLRAVRQKVTV